MHLILSSDGKTAIQNIKEITDKNPLNLKVAWIITASKTDENSSFLNYDLDAFLKEGITPTIYDIKGRDIERIKEDLKDMDIIFMEGGNTFYLLQAIRETGFDTFLKEWIKTKPYAGVSAGSYVACPTIEMATWKHPDRDTHGLSDLTGLGFVDFLVTVHFKNEHLDSIREGMKNSEYELRILKDGQALLIENENVTLLGNQNSLDYLL